MKSSDESGSLDLRIDDKVEPADEACVVRGLLAFNEARIGRVSLDTFDYQARPFYEKLGYELFGTLEGYPPGSRQYYLRKQLRT